MNVGIDKIVANNLHQYLTQHKPFKESLLYNKGEFKGYQYIGGDKSYEFTLIEKGILEEEKMKIQQLLNDKKEELQYHYNLEMDQAKKLFLGEYEKMKNRDKTRLRI